jgi:hypothetical protein
VPAEDDLDLPAAALRADHAELAMSVDVLASKLEQSLPQATEVQRHKIGGFRSKRREVHRIAIVLGEDQFELLREDQRIHCTRHKVVRGITLSRQEMPMADWISEVIAGVTQSAQVSEQDRIALQELLR